MSWWRRILGLKPNLPPAPTVAVATTAPQVVVAIPAATVNVSHDNAAMPGTSKVEIGVCASCGKPMKAKARAVRSRMQLTCKCGHVNVLTVAPELVVSLKEALHPTPVLDETSQAVLEMRDRLLAIYRATTMPPGEGGISYRDPRDTDARAAIREIGQRAWKLGGMDVMLRVHDAFRNEALGLDPSWNRNLETHWDGIGNWLK